MPGPFPGMDPYIEDPAFWPDFHRRFITYCSDVLAERLPDDYEVRIDEQVRVVTPDEPPARYYPDMAVSQDPEVPSAGGGGAPSSAVAVLDPVRMTVLEEIRDVWLQILHRPERGLVTILEVLSPSNKVGAGLRDYTARRDLFLHQNVNFVEINLLVGGTRPGIASPWPAGDYYALIVRGDRHPDAGATSWTVRDPLPIVPVPLRAPDPDAPLDLPAAFATAYERGRYARSVNYVEPPVAPISPADLSWATEIAAAFTRRR